MCGILCYIYGNNPNNGENFTANKEFQSTKTLIEARGPDSYFERYEKLSYNKHAYFIGSVLWMQGNTLFSQPCVDNEKNILLWNGDIFSGCFALDQEKSDTEIILKELEKSTDIISSLHKIEGPFSIIYYQKSTNLLYFGRDKVGRHSLLIKIENQNALISSIVTKEITDIIEVPAIGLFVLDLSNPKLKIRCYPWNLDNYTESVNVLKQHLKMDIDVHCNNLEKSVHNYTLPSNIDTFYLSEISNKQNIDEIMASLLENKTILGNVTKLLSYLCNSVKLRIETKPEICKICTKLENYENLKCNHSKVGIPFSGGVDSAIIAVLADKYVPKTESIDLINVAFEKKVGSDYQVPDRITGRSTYEELLQICPDRKWNFIEVNITREELQTTIPHISNLIYPLNTVLDESLGCALYFASKAKGILFPNKEFYESPSRILLLGMGADELFGGYMRHRTILKRNGWQDFIQELNLEFSRISKRNLGRDDRIVSDTGRQARFPYLDDHLISFVKTLKPWERCYPTEDMPCGLGEKMLLRLTAQKLNLKKAASFPKRAFQFGSRIANGKQNAKDISNCL